MEVGATADATAVGLMAEATEVAAALLAVLTAVVAPVVATEGGPRAAVLVEAVEDAEETGELQAGAVAVEVAGATEAEKEVATQVGVMAAWMEVEKEGVLEGARTAVAVEAAQKEGVVATVATAVTVATGATVVVMVETEALLEAAGTQVGRAG